LAGANNLKQQPLHLWASYNYGSTLLQRLRFDTCKPTCTACKEGYCSSGWRQFCSSRF